LDLHWYINQVQGPEFQVFIVHGPTWERGTNLGTPTGFHSKTKDDAPFRFLREICLFDPHSYWALCVFEICIGR
jgi:hypothetical protein